MTERKYEEGYWTNSPCPLLFTCKGVLVPIEEKIGEYTCTKHGGEYHENDIEHDINLAKTNSLFDNPHKIR